MLSILHFLAAVVLVVQTPAPAQLTLTVTDATGGRVADATVVLRNALEQRTFATGSEGVVELRDLPAGGIISRSGNDVPHVPAVIWNLTPTSRIGPITFSAMVRNVGARFATMPTRAG